MKSGFLKKTDAVLKRAYDIVFAVVFIILTGWIMLIDAAIIKLTSPGPILYRARRMGYKGQIITVYKFRSMRVDSGRVKVTTLEDDDRIYPFGKVLRKTKMDELPQFFNVLFGSMSVVGPRPEDIDIAERYIEIFKKIYEAKPGLTSPASLFDYTHGEVYEDEELYEREFLPDKLAMELYYTKNHNIFYDIFISAKTAWIIILKVIGKKDLNYPREYYLMDKIELTEVSNEREGAFKG